ncbi:hypothetical protein B0F90DRAFT_1938175 [Multifurca ochricompacta]|uniref:N-acetyltransferase domain-containing protein n=1 Tax=Multifurca ochricompacta TaxID=376703 RepID=A0AAD4M200_9AGAM|nr:hypothetical protein B0F90DRAFT_1938175 [Multifurca ochricompacta]
MSAPIPIARRLTSPNTQERTRVVEILETALLDDKAILCLTGASKTSERELYKICLNICLRDGEVWVAGFNDQINAVTFWIRPGADFHIGLSDDYIRDLPDDMKEWMAHHFVPKYNELYKGSYPTGQQVRVQAWHILLIGVQPTFQRRGLGKRLLDVLREKADSKSQCITADVQTSFAVHFFNNSGFAYTGVKNFISRQAGFPLWSMLRLPFQAQAVPGIG